MALTYPHFAAPRSDDSCAPAVDAPTAAPLLSWRGRLPAPGYRARFALAIVSLPFAFFAAGLLGTAHLVTTAVEGDVVLLYLLALMVLAVCWTIQRSRDADWSPWLLLGWVFPFAAPAHVLTLCFVRSHAPASRGETPPLAAIVRADQSPAVPIEAAGSASRPDTFDEFGRLRKAGATPVPHAGPSALRRVVRFIAIAVGIVFVLLVVGLVAVVVMAFRGTGLSALFPS